MEKRRVFNSSVFSEAFPFAILSRVFGRASLVSCLVSFGEEPGRHGPASFKFLCTLFLNIVKLSVGQMVSRKGEKGLICISTIMV